MIVPPRPKSKYFIAIAGAMMLMATAKAQLLTTSPAFPVDTSTVTITVDATRGNRGLMNYTGNVYVHVGLITSASTGPSDWKYVPFTWGTANSAAQAASTGANKWSYTINNIRAFFNVPAGETIKRIAILFRDAAGTNVQRNADGSDMYLGVYDNMLHARFVLPPMQPFFNPQPEPITRNVGDTIAVNYVVNKTANINLYFNGNLVSSGTGLMSSGFKTIISQAGNQQIIATANDGSTTQRDTISFYVAPPAVFAPLPAGVKEGINYPAGDSSAVLVLYAPQKNKIVVTGDFSNWTQQTAYQMNRTPDSLYFWVKIGGLTPGTEYAYQYVIDDSITVADYNTEKVLDKNVDPGIAAATYPGLKAFPSKASGTLASVIQTARASYNWQVNNFQRPAKANLVVYELLVRDFLANGNWQTLKDTLSYLKSLGVNAIELMPFTNFEGASSWGYNPNFYFAPAKVYGTETALKQFIDACHQQGMAVIMDMVLNHSFGSSPMVQMYWDGKNNIPAANNPWFNQYPTHAFNVGYQFNHESAATKTFTQRVLNYWLTNYHIDGYRFDLAKGFTQKRTCDAYGNNCDVTAWGVYDPSRVAIWDTIYNQLQAISPGSYCILEMFADNTEQKLESDYGMLLWGNMNYNFNQGTMGYTNGWDLGGAVYSNLGWGQPGLVVYQESHDEERLMFRNEQYGNSSGSYNVKDTANGLLRNAMAAAFWAMVPGPKMLWQFGEMGYDYSINTCSNGTINNNCRLDAKPVKWSYLSDNRRKRLHDVYQALLKLKKNYPGLAVPNSSAYALGGAFKTLQVSDTAIGVTLMGNFDVVNSSGTVSFQHGGTWYNYFTGEALTATGGAQTITLSPGEFRLYVDKNVTNIITTAVPDINYAANPFGISVYPNPAVGSRSAISYELPAWGKTVLRVVNAMGQQVGPALELGLQPKGKYTLSLNKLAPLPAGIYFLQMEHNRQRSQVGFVVAK